MEELIGKPRVQQWEGLTVTQQVEEGKMIHDTINQYGYLGWEFCQWLPIKSNQCLYIFKRPLQ